MAGKQREGGEDKEERTKKRRRGDRRERKGNEGEGEKGRRGERKEEKIFYQKFEDKIHSIFDNFFLEKKNSVSKSKKSCLSSSPKQTGDSGFLV